ncbi:response regulator [Sulfitobacter delicatus]|uniref:Transcriptional regulatory protein, C terminal n=1 Tax=Sulfitobacter delicatus TaxID=218672 RepID=A0A1G7XSW1_9RHOB|nr:response regulator [Sulfitobacter delicatus]SDG87204.1 Transcriptional regulatory protein, C terminal [Sulfitobacter delicatus]
MSEKKILVVDDDSKIRTLLRRCLEGDGYAVSEAQSAQSVREAFEADQFDLVTLDLNLGADDGLDIARELRRDHDVPIFMVTGKDDVIDRVVGLELGADDYLTKPFHVREVLARVKSVLRRSGKREPEDASQDTGQGAEDPWLSLDGLKVKLDRMLLVDREGAECDLTTADFKLLAAFLNHAKKPLSRDRLMDLIDGQAWAPLDRTIDNQVARLRKKVERDPARPMLIKTVRGIGYILTENAVAVEH